MRFKAVLKDAGCLTSVLSALEKLSNDVSILLSEESVKLVVLEESTEGEQAFAELAVAQVFDSYRVESKANNCILLRARIGTLLRAIHNGKDAWKTTLKLTKKLDRAYLSFDIQTDRSHVVQDVPVRVCSSVEMENVKEPALPVPKVKVLMPDLRALQTVVDHMKAISKTIRITISSAGEACFQVQTPLVTIKTFYKDLNADTLENIASQRGPGEFQHTMASATLSIKKLHHVMQSNRVEKDYALGLIVEQRAFIVYIKLARGCGMLTFYIPLIAEEIEEDEDEDEEEGMSD
jgi:HUS1 checkpoint protein